MHSIKLCGKEDEKEEQSCNPSLSTDMSGVCDEVLSHKEGCSSPQINTFFNVMPSGISLDKGGICLLSSEGKKEDLPPKAHEESEALIAESLSKNMDVSLKKYSMGPLLQYSKYHPDKSLEEGSY